MQNPPLNTLRGMPRHKRNHSPSPGFYNDFIEVRQIQTTKTMEGLYMIDQCYQIMFVSIICCYVTNCHKLSSLKQHTFTISQFLWVRNLGTTLLYPLIQGLTQVCNQGVSWGWDLIWKPSWGIICFSAPANRQDSTPFWFLDWEVQFLVGYWLEATLRSLPWLPKHATCFIKPAMKSVS